ncbi:hypothetical protein D3C81_1995330 [compost metagenome]
MHRFLDVCLSVQQDRDLAASLHVSDLVAPALQEEEDIPLMPLDIAEDTEESEEDALARAIAAEQAELETQE